MTGEEFIRKLAVRMCEQMLKSTQRRRKENGMSLMREIWACMGLASCATASANAMMESVYGGGVPKNYTRDEAARRRKSKKAQKAAKKARRRNRA